MNEELRKDLEGLINWLYKASFTDIFKYDRATQKRSLSKKTEERINKIINKYENK